MKNKKIIVILISILGLIIIIAGILLILNKKDKFNFNADNFSVEIKEYNLYFDSEEDEDSLFVKVDNNNYHIIDEEDQYYFINNEIIESLERKRDGKVIWVYEKNKPKNLISSINGFTHEEFVKNSIQFPIDIVNELKNAKYKKDDNTCNVKLTPELSANIEKIIKENWIQTNLIFDKNDNNRTFSDCADCFQVYEIKEIEFTTNDNYIEKLKIVLTNVVYDQNGNINENWSYEETEETALVFKFSNYDNTHIELSDEIKQSLSNTQAKEFVGNYVNKKTCSDGKNYDETIELTNKFDFISGMGWEVNYNIFDCESGYYTKSSAKYDIENNIITFYELGDVVAKFKYENNQLNKLDDKNNVVSTFNKQ